MRRCRVRPTSTWSGMTRCHVEAVRHKNPKAYSLRSRKVEAIEVHHLGPRRDEVSSAASVTNCARSTSNSSADTGYLPLR